MCDAAGRGPADPSDSRLMADRVMWDERTVPGGVRVVTVRGALVWPGCFVLARRVATIAPAARRGLVLDLSEVTEIDTSLVGLLGAAARQLAWRGRRLVVVAGGGEVLATVMRAAAGAGLLVVDTRGEALAAAA